MSGDAGTCSSNSKAAAVAPTGVNSLNGHLVISMARVQLRSVDKDLFTPLCVPIGPYHHAKCSVRWKQKKERVAEEIMKFLGNGGDQLIEELGQLEGVAKIMKYLGNGGGQLIEELGQLEGDAKDLYDCFPHIHMDSKQFLSMLLQDGCYVLLFFVEIFVENKRLGGDRLPIAAEENTVMHDIMYLVENQIPMVVLQKIYGYMYIDGLKNDTTLWAASDRSCLDGIAHRVRLLLEGQFYISTRLVPLTTSYSHVLQMVHTFLQPTRQRSTATEVAGHESSSNGGGGSLIEMVPQPGARAQQRAQDYAASGQETPQERTQEDEAVGQDGGGQQGTQGSAAMVPKPTTNVSVPVPNGSTPQGVAEQDISGRVQGNAPHEGRNEAHIEIGMGRWRRATEYCGYANVQLKRRDFVKGVVESILDVGFEGSTLSIPLLRIDRSTWTMLRNLMAMEEQEGTDGSPVTAYCVFMSQLASKVEDIELLQRRGILEHFWGNDEEVAQGFAKLCKGVVLDLNNANSNYLYNVWHQLQKRYDSLGHNCWGSFRDKHCGNSMRILAFVTAGLLFAFQLIQVILTGFSLRHQGK